MQRGEELRAIMFDLLHKGVFLLLANPSLPPVAPTALPLKALGWNPLVQPILVLRCRFIEDCTGLLPIRQRNQG
jgi:hypothetical protein